MTGSLFQVWKVFCSLVVVNISDEVRSEVDDLFKLLRRHVKQVSETARHTLEEPNMGHRRSELYMAHALATDLCSCYLNATPLAYNSLEAYAFVLSAVTLPVPRGTKDSLIEEAVLLRLERPVVDCFRLFHLTVRPGPNLLGRRKTDLQFVKKMCHYLLPLSNFSVELLK